MHKTIENNLQNFYDSHLVNYGPGAMGVGWKNEAAQQIRFDQLAKIIEPCPGFTINDLGCGVGDFYTYLTATQQMDFHYYGYDMLKSMVDSANTRFGTSENAHWIKIDNAHELLPADYTIASGIFNLKYTIEESEWKDYIIETLHQMDAKSKRGFAFNMLTIYSDKEFSLSGE
jgi:cyclopropane fatty-acyl-phospholipid synthase-like methyltransferase